MNYADIKYCDVANGTGCRTVLFVSGCRNHCPGCFQPETWDFSYGEPFGEEIQEEIIRSLEPSYIQGITLLGGEPFEPENQKELALFLKKLKERYPEKDVWAFTGYVYDRDLVQEGARYTEDTDALLDRIDILVDGPFIEEKKNMMLKFRGSENQRILDLKKTRQEGRLVLWDSDGR